jgi:hypothetical protein
MSVKVMKPVTKEITPLADLLKPGLAGCCFITRDERGRVIYQGVVHCVVPSQQGDLVLIQYFDAMYGALNTMALVPLSDMVAGKEGRYVFFADDAHLRDYMENVQRHLEERLDREDTRKSKATTEC